MEYQIVDRAIYFIDIDDTFIDIDLSTLCENISSKYSTVVSRRILNHMADRFDIGKTCHTWNRDSFDSLLP